MLSTSLSPAISWILRDCNGKAEKFAKIVHLEDITVDVIESTAVILTLL
jgi:hypothetical protein